MGVIVGDSFTSPGHSGVEVGSMRELGASQNQGELKPVTDASAVQAGLERTSPDDRQ
jgi:hypothetical protein